MKDGRASILRLFHATFLFGIACGVSLALTPLLLSDDFDKPSLGWLAVANALGIVVMSLPAGFLAKRVSPSKALVVYLMAYACFDAALPFVHGAMTISVVRFFDGACSVGVWVSSETLLLGHTHKGDKANLTSQYAIWLASGYVGGSIVARLMAYLHHPRSDAYLASGAIAVLAAIYVALTVRTPAKIAPESATELTHAADAERLVISEAPMSAAAILKRIRCSCFATFVYGYFQAGVVLFLPLYLVERKGIEADKTTLIPGIFCFGMLIMSNPMGRLADRHGHLLVMRILAAIGIVFILGFIFLDDWRAMYAAVFCAGGTLAAMSPVSLALQGVVTPPREYARGNSLYNLLYASGILLGPPISGALFSAYGGGTMLAHLAALWGAFIVFSLIYAADDPAYRGSLRRAAAS